MVTIVNSTNTNDICLICGIVQSSIKWTIISNCRNHDYVISCYLPYLVTKLATKNSNKEMLLYTQQERISKYEDKSCNKIMVSSNINVMIEKKGADKMPYLCFQMNTTTIIFIRTVCQVKYTRTLGAYCLIRKLIESSNISHSKIEKSFII